MMSVGVRGRGLTAGARTFNTSGGLVLALLVGAIAFACGGNDGVTLDRTASAPSAEGLPIDVILNATYAIEGSRAEFDDGVHYWVRLPGETEMDSLAPLQPREDWRSTISRDLIAMGDLNRDGAEDAAVVIRSQFGGSGVFVTLAAVLNTPEAPEHVASAHLGDRVVVNSVAIESAVITLEMLTHAEPDSPQWAGQCCPNVPTVLRFRLAGTELIPVP